MKGNALELVQEGLCLGCIPVCQIVAGAELQTLQVVQLLQGPDADICDVGVHSRKAEPSQQRESASNGCQPNIGDAVTAVDVQLQQLGQACCQVAQACRGATTKVNTLELASFVHTLQTRKHKCV